MKVAILHSEVPEAASWDEQDVLVQVAVVSQALIHLGYVPAAVPFSARMERTIQDLKEIGPAWIFNLVETVEGRGRFIHLAPLILDLLNIPYTGNATDAVHATSNKRLAKSLMVEYGIPTPPWFTLSAISEEPENIEGRFIIKSVWEHASVGLDEDSVMRYPDGDSLRREMERRCERLGGECIAEQYIEGREFNLSLLANENGAEVLPPAEIHFENYPSDKTRVVGYRAKWDADSFEYHHTPRSFDFPETDQPLLQRLCNLAQRCWKRFHLRGYVRVDFRADHEGRPWVLEINTNPCLSPDSGFTAATRQAGLSIEDVIRRIIQDSIPDGAGGILRDNENPMAAAQ